MASTASPQPSSRLKSKRSTFSDFVRLRVKQESTQIAVGVACVVLALFFAVWRGPLPFESLVRSFARVDAMDGAWALASKEALLRKYYGLSLAAGLGLVGTLALLAVGWRRLGEAAQAMLWRGMATLACSCALWIYMSKMEFAHIPIDVLMTHPGAEPIFGHRLLFVWIADAFHALVPASSYLRCYYASQVVATLLTLYAIGRWSALFVGESLSWLGQVLAVVMISSCFGYRDFYDIGIVFFFTCGFLAIYRRKYWWLPVIVTLGTLNHENVLLLVLVAGLLMFDENPRRAWLPAVALSLLGYIAVRLTLQAEIPFHRQVDWRVWSNMVKPFEIPHEMAYSVLALGGWYVLGLMSLADCDRRSRRLAWLFPLLFGVTLLFGQFHEPRQFDAFIPVLIAMLLNWTARRLKAENTALDKSGFWQERSRRTPQETKAA
jgi:hypothetical protein